MRYIQLAMLVFALAVSAQFASGAGVGPALLEVNLGPVPIDAYEKDGRWNNPELLPCCRDDQGPDRPRGESILRHE